MPSIYSRIDELKSKLYSMRPLNPSELRRIHEEFMLENTYDSNAIEGNSLTLRETTLVLKEGLTIAGKPLKDHLEVVGHKNAFEMVDKLSQLEQSLDEETILSIHSLVLLNDNDNRGKYREVQVMLMGSDSTLPPPSAVPQKMRDLLNWYFLLEPNSTEQVIQAIAKFHLDFEGVHPFIDGNGRTGRLIMNLELMKHGLLPITIKFTDKHLYYGCFPDYEKTGSTEMLKYLIAKYEMEELEKRINLLEPKLQ